jgi:4-carboxymuconolactone decarboxylase
MSDARDVGAKVFGEVLGGNTEAGLRESFKSDAFGIQIAKFAAEFAFGTIWSRDGLERKQRSLVTMGILIGLRQFDELKIHTQIALRNGLTVKEIEEVLYQALPYAGFPACNLAKAAMEEGLKEAGQLPST